ncbi:hypothetical protein PAEPH01_2135 [Pancytospora epiphaga]|nr:hypothetical protein PAEPH01_2135 [Pancytospora epiphaga]
MAASTNLIPVIEYLRTLGVKYPEKKTQEYKICQQCHIPISKNYIGRHIGNHHSELNAKEQKKLMRDSKRTTHTLINDATFMLDLTKWSDMECNKVSGALPPSNDAIPADEGGMMEFLNTFANWPKPKPSDRTNMNGGSETDIVVNKMLEMCMVFGEEEIARAVSIFLSLLRPEVVPPRGPWAYPKAPLGRQKK